MYLIIYLNFR